MVELIGIDGPDGAGKTTLAKNLSQYTNSTYMYFTEENILKDLRKSADILSPSERFAFYLSVNLMNQPRLAELKQNMTSAIILDRTPLSTYAYHDVMGINTQPFHRLYDHLLDQFDGFCYVFASPETRMARMEMRLKGRGEMHKFDKFSLQFEKEIHKAYMSVLPEGAILIDTTNLAEDETLTYCITELNIKDLLKC